MSICFKWVESTNSMMFLFNSGDFRFIFAPFDFSGDVSDGTTSIGGKTHNFFVHVMSK